MAYTPITAGKFRDKAGSISQKICSELAVIKTETDSLDTLTSNLLAVFVAGPKVAKIRCPGAAQNSQSFSWQNPETSKILIYKAILHVFDNETVGVGTLMDIGVAANGTTSSDTIMDGVALTSTGLFDNITNKGTNGLPQVIVDELGGSNDYVTGTINTATGASFTGCLYIFYTVLGFTE